MESFSTQENRQPLDVATAIAPQADTDGWSRVIASLSTDQRIGLHMLGMHRTWQAVSSIFSAWASILKRRGSTGASHTVSADRAPLEPDFSPRQLDLGLSPQSQSHYMRADMHPHTTPQLTPADLERSAYTQTVEDNSDPQSLPYKPPPPPTPSLAALQPHGALSIYSTALHPSTSSSTVIPAVVMSNFPRQQVCSCAFTAITVMLAVTAFAWIFQRPTVHACLRGRKGRFSSHAAAYRYQTAAFAIGGRGRLDSLFALESTISTNDRDEPAASH